MSDQIARTPYALNLILLWLAVLLVGLLVPLPILRPLRLSVLQQPAEVGLAMVVATAVVIDCDRSWRSRRDSTGTLRWLGAFLILLLAWLLMGYLGFPFIFGFMLSTGMGAPAYGIALALTAAVAILLVGWVNRRLRSTWLGPESAPNSC